MNWIITGRLFTRADKKGNQGEQVTVLEGVV